MCIRDSGYSVFTGVGERTREGHDLYGEMRESGVLNKTALVYGQMNEPPGARMRVALSGLTMAEYFRDVKHQDVLLFIDNIFRFTQAGSEVSALLGRMPSAVGYQPTLATEMGALQERITSTRKGSITSVQAVYVPADDLTDPAPATTFTHLDATTVLSRDIASQGIYPAVDPLDSTSRILSPEVVGQEHYEVARAVQQVLQRYKELQDIIAIMGMDELSEEDKICLLYTSRKKLEEDFSFMSYAPIVFISAKTGQRVNKLFETIHFVDVQNGTRVPTGALNEMLARATAKVQPPSDKGKRLKVFYITQISTRPPTFVCFVNQKALFHFSYQRYLENQIRETFGLTGTPIKMITREHGDGAVKAGKV